jgi:hypothetical protein
MITIIDLAIKKENIAYKSLPVEVKQMIDDADLIQRVSCQEVIGYKNNKTLWSAGGYYSGKYFVITSIGGWWYGNKLQYGKHCGFKIFIN